MPALSRAELVDLLAYALLKVPPLTRAALLDPDSRRSRAAEATIADRVARAFEQLEVTAPPGHEVFASDPRQVALPLPPPVLRRRHLRCVT